MDMTKAKNEAFIYYNSMRAAGLFCPAFNEKVHVTLMGWNHLVRPKNKSRTNADLYRRFKLLKHVREIVEKSATIQDITTKGGRTFYALEAMVVEDVNNVKVARKVRVLIADSVTGKKFYSVMDKKKKI